MAKASDAFRTISEVADELEIPKHVLRFWEDRFSQLRPMKRGGGRRLYRPEDFLLLRGIQAYLHVDSYTIKGVQKILREQGVEAVKRRARELDAQTSGEGAGAAGSSDRDVALDVDTAPSPPTLRANAKRARSKPIDRAVRKELLGLLNQLEDCRSILQQVSSTIHHASTATSKTKSMKS